jgi:hypothetical protein
MAVIPDQGNEQWLSYIPGAILSTDGIARRISCEPFFLILVTILVFCFTDEVFTGSLCQDMSTVFVYSARNSAGKTGCGWLCFLIAVHQSSILFQIGVNTGEE